ncbi:MAG: PepSY domain-containing protein [Hyphomicrobium sp.]|uniref:PepSY domain-containing protein n=1 Tax=Hyphomicrobium sp. TaxID=82 RepID=UPI00132BFE25|nr:PepSY domain-containing protein [Hyphomicrobium sp.]KAB2941760.1 MAG: PepSY domain-containing protein [Hyphomicrobium sp.]MBZ0210294.1 PepSY domain-containing protein [Hyphomicrobium sp.]
MNKVLLALAGCGVLFAGSALAGSYAGTCTNAPKAQWMTEAAAQAKIAAVGFTVKKIKTTRVGNCFEAYVTDKDGTKFELFLDPTTANVVHAQ